MLNAEPQWVAVYTHPRAEKKVAEYLEKHGYECYLPLRRELHKWSDRRQWVETPLLKSYVFARITERQVSLVQSMPGVAFLVRFAGKVAVVRDEEITMMKLMIASEKELFVKGLEQLRRGRKVRINSGYMEGWEGVLVSDCEEGNFAVEIKGISMAIVMQVEGSLLSVVEEE